MPSCEGQRQYMTIEDVAHNWTIISLVYPSDREGQMKVVKLAKADPDAVFQAVPKEKESSGVC